MSINLGIPEGYRGMLSEAAWGTELSKEGLVRPKWRRRNRPIEPARSHIFRASPGKTFMMWEPVDPCRYTRLF